jgi:uncharacterized protein
MNNSNPRKINILVFAKAPVPGFAKTRLIPELGPQGAAELANKLLSHTLKNAVAADIGRVTLCATPNASDAAWLNLSAPKSIHWVNQGDGDLGKRLARVAQEYLVKGEAVILIGTDCPEITADKLRYAVTSLATQDAFIIPATDGGYTLLGLNKFDASLFSDIHWSTDSVFAETIQRIKKLQWSFEVDLPLHDIDEPEDLQWIPSHWALSEISVGN